MRRCRMISSADLIAYRVHPNDSAFSENDNVVIHKHDDLESDTVNDIVDIYFNM